MAKALQEEELTELVKEVAEEAVDVDLSDATPQTTLRSLGMDSLDQLEFVTALEDRLELCIPDGQVKGLETVGDLIAVLTELQAARPSPGGSTSGGTGDEERLTDAG